MTRSGVMFKGALSPCKLFAFVFQKSTPSTAR
jgi:hypothetical protein